MSIVIAEPGIAKSPSFVTEKEKPLSPHEAQQFAMLAAQFDAKYSGVIGDLKRGLSDEMPANTNNNTNSSQSSTTDAAKPSANAENSNTGYTGSPEQVMADAEKLAELSKAQQKEVATATILTGEKAPAPKTTITIDNTGLENDSSEKENKPEAILKTAEEKHSGSLSPGLDAAGVGLLGERDYARRRARQIAIKKGNTPIIPMPAGSKPRVPAIAGTSSAITFRR